MKRFLFVLFSFFVFLSIVAHDFESGGIYYNITSSADKTVGVTYGEDPRSGPGYHAVYTYTDNVIIPEIVTCNDTNYSVTSIDYEAFAGNIKLTSVTIPNSITSIGYDAFVGCSGLTSVTIPNSITSIGYQAFAGCSGLTSVTIGNSVTSIGVLAFDNCSGLKKAVFADVESLCKIEFGNASANPLCFANHLYFSDSENEVTDLVIPNSVTSIGNYAFYDCSGLTSVTIPNSVTSIGGYAFYGCSGLTSVTMPYNTGLGQSIFNGCTSLPVENNVRYADTYLVGMVDKTATRVTIKDGTRYIGSSAFKDCTSLTSVSIPNSVGVIHYYAFQNCSSLNSIEIGNGIWEICSDAFKDCNNLTKATFTDIESLCKIVFHNSNANPLSITHRLLLKDHEKEVTELVIPNTVKKIPFGTFYGCRRLKSVTIPESVTSIGKSAFCYCTGLTSVSIGNNVETIGDYVFYQCSGLSSVTIPNSVTTIGKYTFYQCTGLTSVSIGNSVASIDEYAFYDCTDLKSVTSLAVNPPTLANMNVFSDATYDTAILYVPDGTSSQYSSSLGWEYFLNIDDSGVEGVKMDSDNAVPVGYYDLNGVRYAEPQPGANIVRYSDGTTKKVIVK